MVMPEYQPNMHLLFRKVAANLCTPQELELFFRMIREQRQDDTLSEALDQWWDEVPISQADTAHDIRIQQLMNARKKVRVIRWRIAAAASLLVLVTAVTFLLRGKRDGHNSPTTITEQVVPGTSKATLVLADGTLIQLDSLHEQSIQQNGAIIRHQKGELQYTHNGEGAISYNTLRIPRGGYFRIRLSDGTQVWLNAASSLRYPTAFTAKERIVEVSGEAYFEVAPHADQPFQVRIGEAAIEVLGTSFNVNAYTVDTNIRITLIDGAVSVRTPGQAPVLLKPGQQAGIRTHEAIRIIEKVNTSQVTAWKEGMFDFDGVALQEVMEQLSRWYDIDVSYEGTVPALYFEGRMDRGLNLSQVLEILKETGIKYKLDGKKLIIRP